MTTPNLARATGKRAPGAAPGIPSHRRGRPALGDFTIDPRVLPLIAMALVVGSTGAGAAWLLVKLITLVTNLAYYGRLTTQSLPIAGTPLGPFAALVPVAGCLVIGLMAASAPRRSGAMAYPRRWRRSSSAAAASSPRWRS
jgi:hypothetical protein